MTNSFPKFKQIRVDDTNANIKINQNLDSLKKVLDVLTTQPNKIPLTQISLTSGVNVIPHGLNRPLTGWTPIRVRAQTFLWDSQDTGALPDIYLYLNSSEPAVVDLEVW